MVKETRDGKGGTGDRRVSRQLCGLPLTPEPLRPLMAAREGRTSLPRPAPGVSRPAHGRREEVLYVWWVGYPSKPE
jgi:hypothetical protein